MGGRWRLGAGALSGSGLVAGGGLTQRAARWSVRTGQSGGAGAQARALERMGWGVGHKEGTKGLERKEARAQGGRRGMGSAGRHAGRGAAEGAGRKGPFPSLALSRVQGPSPSPGETVELTSQQRGVRN